nr:hypothetical protein [candidate division Zixibacteria bacterium]
MTEKLYLNDGEMLDFTARVISADQVDGGWEIILDRTAFYPQSGGQLFDTGLLDNKTVINVLKRDDEVVHVVADWETDIGTLVEGKIDRERRLDNRRKHTGQHILSQSFIRTAGAKTVSAHLGEIESTIELSVAEIDENQLEAAEDLANRIVMENHPIEIGYYDREELGNMPIRKIPELGGGEYRIIGIGDFDYTACGGTHCRRTGEIGSIKIIGQEKIRGHVRIIFLTGRQAVTDYREKHKVLTSLVGRLTCHFTDLDGSVGKILEQNVSLRRDLTDLNRQMMSFRAESLIKNAVPIAGGYLVVDRFDGIDIKNLRELAQVLVQKGQVAVVLLADDKVLMAASEDSGFDASHMARIFMENFGGRGGGNRAFAQVGGIPLDKRSEISDNLINILKQELGG